MVTAGARTHLVQLVLGVLHLQDKPKDVVVLANGTFMQHFRHRPRHVEHKLCHAETRSASTSCTGERQVAVGWRACKGNTGCFSPFISPPVASCMHLHFHRFTQEECDRRSAFTFVRHPCTARLREVGQQCLVQEGIPPNPLATRNNTAHFHVKLRNTCSTTDASYMLAET